MSWLHHEIRHAVAHMDRGQRRLLPSLETNKRIHGHLLLASRGWTPSTGCSANCESATEAQRHKPRRVKCNFTSYCTSCPHTSEKWRVRDATETFRQQRVSRIVLFLSEGQRGSRWALWKKRYEDVSTVTLCEWQLTQVTGWSHCVVVPSFLKKRAREVSWLCRRFLVEKNSQDNEQLLNK